MSETSPKDKNNNSPKIITQNDKTSQIPTILNEKMNNSSNFVLKEISLLNKSNLVCDQKLIEAKQFAKILQSCNHPNIAKYIDEVQIQSKYFIKMEAYEYTLKDYIEKTSQQTFNEQQYIEFALQLLYAIQYLHQNNYFLGYLSLEEILINENKQIIIYDFESEYNKRIKKLVKCLKQKQQDKKIYFPPYIQQLLSKEIACSNSSQIIEGDIWLFGICMYIIAGASYSDVEQFQKGDQTFKILKTVNLEINQILLEILTNNPKSRLSIDEVLEKFKSIKMQQTFQNKQKIFQFSLQCFEYFEFKASIPYLERLIELESLNDQYIAMLGRAYLEIEKVDEACAMSLKCLEINPQNTLSMSVLGLCFFQKKEYKTSQEYMNKCLQINSQDILALIIQAKIYNYYRKYDQAIKICKNILETNPNYLHAMIELGVTYYQTKDFDIAIHFFKKPQEIKSNFIFSFVKLADVYTSQKKYDLAFDYLQKGQLIEPNSIKILYQFGKYYKSLKESNQAIDYFKKSLLGNPNCALPYYDLGSIYYKINQYNLALEFLLKSLQIQPYQRKANFMIGKTYYKKSNYSKAQYYLKQTLKIQPHDKNAYNTLGNVYYSLKMYDLSIEYYKKGLQIFPNNEVFTHLQNVKKLI